MVKGYWSTDTFFGQVSVDRHMDVQHQRAEGQHKPRVQVSINLLAAVWPPSCATQLRRRAYAPTSNAASHDNLMGLLFFPM